MIPNGIHGQNRGSLETFSEHPLFCTNPYQPSPHLFPYPYRPWRILKTPKTHNPQRETRPEPRGYLDKLSINTHSKIISNQAIFPLIPDPKTPLKTSNYTRPKGSHVPKQGYPRKNYHNTNSLPAVLINHQAPKIPNPPIPKLFPPHYTTQTTQ